MGDALRRVLALADAGVVLSADDRARLAPAAWAAADRLGLLIEAGPAAAVACDGCGGDHVEPVQWVDVPGRPRRAVVPCPSAGRVVVALDRLRQWVADAGRLAAVAAGAVGATGGVAERVPGRVWRLGVLRAGGRARVGFLAVGLGRPDAAAVVGAVPELRAAAAVVFVPAAPPAAAAWGSGQVPAVVSLADVLAAGDDGLSLAPDALAAALGPDAGAEATGEPVAALPPGTTWEQVALVVGDHHLDVRAGDAAHRVGYEAAGFADARGGAPDRLWRVLAALARGGGELGTGDAITTKPGRLKTAVADLRGRLRALTGVPGDPFHPTRRGAPYRARFRVRPAGGAVFPTPPGATWDRVAIAEVADGVVAVAIDADATGVGWAGGDAPSREAATTRGERSRRYPLADLGLTDPARAALVEVLRAGGRVRRRPTDPAMLALGAGLTRFLGLTGPPFDHRDGVWVAAFDATSLVPASDR